MSQFHHPVNEEKSYRRALFAFTALALAGCCSIYPVACFKNYSTKEKAKLDKQLAKVERKAEAEEDWLRSHRPRAPRSPSEIRGRGSRDVSSEREHLARVRSGPGPGSPPTPPRSPTSEAISPQLLGGRVGPDADILIDDSPESAISTAKYHTVRKASAVVRLRGLLSPQWTSRHTSQLTPEVPADEAEVPVTPPSTDSSAETKSSHTSGASQASSIAYLVQDNRGDKRLLQKKSQPLAHHVKQAPLSRNKPAELRHTPSYYKPKVIEDSAAIVTSPSAGPLLRSGASVTAAEFMSAPETSPPKSKPAALRSSSLARPSRQVHGSGSQGRSGSTSPRLLPTPPPPSMLKRPTLLKTSTSKDFSKPLRAPRQVRIEIPKKARSTSHEVKERRASRPQNLPLPPPLKLADLPPTRQYHDVTPPEKDPCLSYRARFNHGEHYFRTFGNGKGHIKDFTPTMVPDQLPLPSPAVPPPSPGTVRFATPRIPSDTAIPSVNKRKRSSVFGLFRKTALADSTYEAPFSGIVGTRPPPSSTTPGIAISPPFEPSTKRRSLAYSPSEPFLPPYFAQSKDSTRSSDTSPISPPSPRFRMSESPIQSPRLTRHRLSTQRSSDSFSTASPMTRPRSRPRLRHRATLQEIMDVESPAVVPDNAAKPAVGPRPAAGLQAKYSSSDGKEYYHTAAGPDALHWSSPGSKDIPSPPEKLPPVQDLRKRRSTFKSFLLDLRSAASTTGLKVDPETPEPPTTHRRSSLIPTASMANLLHKASRPTMNKLKRKASHITHNTQDQARERPELEVTNFHQTPYSQRVANNLRTEMNIIRSYVEEALNDNDDDTILGFELDVPDHLPSSPLCPLNPKHKSGGKAICPLHGRRKKGGAMSGKVPSKTTKPAPKPHGPQIVYEGVAEGARRFSAIALVEEDAKRAKILQEGSADGTWYS